MLMPEVTARRVVNAVHVVRRRSADPTLAEILHLAASRTRALELAVREAGDARGRAADPILKEVPRDEAHCGCRPRVGVLIGPTALGAEQLCEEDSRCFEQFVARLLVCSALPPHMLWQQRPHLWHGEEARHNLARELVAAKGEGGVAQLAGALLGEAVLSLGSLCGVSSVSAGACALSSYSCEQLSRHLALVIMQQARVLQQQLPQLSARLHTSRELFATSGADATGRGCGARSDGAPQLLNKGLGQVLTGE